MSLVWSVVFIVNSRFWQSSRLLECSSCLYKLSSPTGQCSGRLLKVDFLYASCPGRERLIGTFAQRSLSAIVTPYQTVASIPIRFNSVEMPWSIPNLLFSFTISFECGGESKLFFPSFVSVHIRELTPSPCSPNDQPSHGTYLGAFSASCIPLWLGPRLPDWVIR